MLIYIIWKYLIIDNELYEYFASMFFSILALPIDIILLPIEIISLIIYKIHNKN